eukprot:CAMPEP_0205930616 /NCGR_PEP_ID=MMETSP1325-20131115/25999_1 /ASSEMBLY_ACC=CAM_ASM_000708 /TAXON_ID=236786 /ORGANISM="Florenciella sp., Strain RCC1007" /LENGTH=62 /DNA_ID=CAMNT_0053300031 /DNA_START=20 /DNA_END=208 /DNA_ORIENTATION=-
MSTESVLDTYNIHKWRREDSLKAQRDRVHRLGNDHAPHQVENPLRASWRAKAQQHLLDRPRE